MMNKINSSYIETYSNYISTDEARFKKLRDNWQIIRDEYINYCKNNKTKIFRARDINPIEGQIDKNDIPWEIIILRCYNKDTNLVKYFPNTMKLLSDQYPNVMFSVLPPGKRLDLHKGAYNGVLRYHLGIIIPTDKENCYIKVNGNQNHWNLGSDIYFDDMEEHEVFNNTNETRVVLMLDVPRKFSNLIIRYLNMLIVSSGRFNINVDTIVKKINKIDE